MTPSDNIAIIAIIVSAIVSVLFNLYSLLTNNKTSWLKAGYCLEKQLEAFSILEVKMNSITKIASVYVLASMIL